VQTTALRQHAWRASILQHPAAVGLGAAALAALISLPYLGAVGLWDPWETHYSEVGREMLARHDLVHPFWQDHWFFSKPPLTPWLAAFGLWLSGGEGVTGELPRYTEWAIRLPFALLAAAAVGVLAYTTAQLTTRRAGWVAGFVLATSPMWLFVSRQAMTDMPYVALATIATCGFVRTLLDEKAPRGWLLGAWAACGAALLGKGLLGPGLPLAVTALFAALTARRRSDVVTAARRILCTDGLVLCAAVGLPWYVAMLRFDGLNAEGKTFFERFIVHDHFARLLAGVHTTTPGGEFTYFIQQGAYGFFPWVGLLPLAVQRLLSGEERRPFARFAATWALFAFALFTASATRFHHYCLPMLPALAVLVAVTVDELLDARPISVPALLLGGVLVLLVGRDLAQRPQRWIELFTYNQDRPYPEALLHQPVLSGAPAWLDTPRAMWLVTAAAAGCLLALGAIAAGRWKGSRQKVVRVLFGVALGLSAWLSWAHWVDLSAHWTQRDLFWRYWRQRGPGEPIAAFFMDWKGETFYSRNTVRQLGPGNYQRELPAYLTLPGRKWMLVEHNRLPWLLQLMGAGHRTRAVDPDLNNKFVLLAVDG